MSDSFVKFIMLIVLAVSFALGSLVGYGAAKKQLVPKKLTVKSVYESCINTEEGFPISMPTDSVRVGDVIYLTVGNE